MLVSARRRRRSGSLKDYRTAEQISQAEAAARVGITQAEWSRFENGTRRPQPDLAERIAKVTGVAVLTLLRLRSVLAALVAGGT